MQGDDCDEAREKQKDKKHKTDKTHNNAEKNKKAAKDKKTKKDTTAKKAKHAKKAKKDKKDTANKAGTSKTAADHSKSADVDFADAVVKRARRAKNDDTCNESDAKPGDCIRVGSDCTGYGSDFLSLMLLGVNALLVFVAEKDAGKRELMKATHRGDVDFSKVIV